MSDLAIKIDDLSKRYRIGQSRSETISHDLNRLWARLRGKEDPTFLPGSKNNLKFNEGSDYVWALKDIDLEIKRGDRVGIIGKNGAGKSTLLKILSKVTTPTRGQIKISGRVGSLLEVGTGFHSEFTGRENIFMNGTILGMRKSEVKKKLDEIVDFSGIEKYLDVPVKRYSSGMIVRLGFAVAAHLEPDILIVDEVLAVGDLEFRKKSIGKMQEVSKGHGRTILFVSHNMSSIKLLCNKGIVLENGCCTYNGTAVDAVKKYTFASSGIENLYNYQSNIAENGDLSIREFSARAKDKELSDLIFREDLVVFSARLEIKNSLAIYDIAFRIKDEAGNILCTLSSVEGKDLSINKKGIYNIFVELPPNLFNSNEYTVDLVVIQNKVLKVFDIKSCISFSVQEKSEDASAMRGAIKPEVSWNVSCEGH